MEFFLENVFLVYFELLLVLSKVAGSLASASKEKGHMKHLKQI